MNDSVRRLRARVKAAVSSGASYDEYSESEMWACVVSAWREKAHDPRASAAERRVVESMTGRQGDIDVGRAINVMAAVLTRSGRALREDGVLTPGDMGEFVELLESGRVYT